MGSSKGELHAINTIESLVPEIIDEIVWLDDSLV